MPSTNAGDPADDLAELIGDFYDQTWKFKGQYKVGQIIRCPVSETRRRHWIADALRSDSRSHDSVSLHIREQQPADFRGKGERLPIAALKLDSVHELILSRAKSRYCVVLGSIAAVVLNTLPEGAERNKATNALTSRYLLAPIFSISRPAAARVFGPTMVARIRALMYPQFFFVRTSGAILQWPGVARLDNIFANELVCDCEGTDLKLSDGALGLLLEQVHWLFGGKPSPEFAEMRELLMAFIPGSSAQ